MFPKCIMKGLAMFLVQLGVAMAMMFARALTLLSFNDICNGVVLLTFCNRNHSIQFHFFKNRCQKSIFPMWILEEELKNYTRCLQRHNTSHKQSCPSSCMVGRVCCYAPMSNVDEK